MPGKRHPIERKALAIAAHQLTNSSTQASEIADVPESTVRYWIQQFEMWNDSELEAFIADKKRAIGGLWAHMGVEALEFAQELRTAGDARGFQSAMLAAGIASTKLESLGQPKDVTPASPTSPSLLREIPGLPTDTKP